MPAHTTIQLPIVFSDHASQSCFFFHHLKSTPLVTLSYEIFVIFTPLLTLYTLPQFLLFFLFRPISPSYLLNLILSTFNLNYSLSLTQPCPIQMLPHAQILTATISPSTLPLGHSPSLILTTTSPQI